MNASRRRAITVLGGIAVGFILGMTAGAAAPIETPTRTPERPAIPPQKHSGPVNPSPTPSAGR